MRFHKLIIFAVLGLFLAPNAVMAVNTVLSGEFDGSEPGIAPLPGSCGGEKPLGFQQAGTFQVSASGTYTVVDAFNEIGVDVTALIYQGSFNSNSPQTNLVTPDGVDLAANVELSTGTQYVLVLQHWCGDPAGTWVNREGAWAVAFSGPGTVTSSLAVAVPAFTSGQFGANDPTASTECGNSQYRTSSSIQVSRSGTYYFRDISGLSGIDVCLQIYSAPFNPAQPQANRVAILDDHGTVELEAGKNYSIVAQPWQGAANGEFFYVLAPPAPFKINKTLAGSWYYPPTAGQGYFIDVLDKSKQMFLAWFTYDLERPPANVEALIGEPGHRWMTALGPYNGDTAELTIYWADGMIFDSEDPPLNPQVADGTMTVKFNSCTDGVLDYDLGSNNVSGQVPIQPLAFELLEPCEALNRGPAKPGPL